MRWQLGGGNVEPVKIICETDWRQCPRAILKYIWTEVVTDVVDCLITEETVWRIIAILIVCAILLRKLYTRRRCMIKATPSKDTLNRVGCKVEDLELKINILTYKLQYGTWPLPHQIRNPALKKQLRNLRLTLSASSDRNAWIKRMLLSSSHDTSRLSQSKFDSMSVQRMTELFDTKTSYVSSEINRDLTPTDYSDVKSLRSTSAESIRKSNAKGGDQRGLSRSENLGKLRRVNTQLSLLPQKDSTVDRLDKKKLQKQKRSKFSTSQSRLAPCDRYTESLHECKRFLKELKESNKRLELECSSSSALTNDDSSAKETRTDEKVISNRYIAPGAARSSIIALEFTLNDEQNRIISGDVTFCLLKSSLHAQTTDAKNASGRREIVGGLERMPVKVESEEKSLKVIADKKMVQEAFDDVPETYRVTSNGLVPSLNSSVHDNLTTTNLPIEDLLTNIVLPPSDNVIQMSQETLHQIKHKLESLDNVLRAYGMLNSRMRIIEESKVDEHDIGAIYRNVIDTLDTIKVEMENINETKTGTVSFDVNVKEYSDKILQTTSSDCELFSSIKSEKSSSMSIKNYNIAPTEESLAAIAERNQRATGESAKSDATFTQSLCNADLILDHESMLNNSKEQDEESRTYVKTFSDSTTRKIILSKRKIEELSQFPIPMETEEDPSIASTSSSQVEISKDSDLENKSTAMLLQEALECKKELLSRLKLQKFYSNIEFGRNNDNYKDNFKNDNDDDDDVVCPEHDDRTFPSKLLDIIAEEQSASTCTDKTSRTYIFLQMNQPSEMSDRSLSSMNINWNEGKQESTESKTENVELAVQKLSKHAVPVVSSQYFSFNDFTIDCTTDDRLHALHDFPELRNIILEEVFSDRRESFEKSESLENSNSSCGKRRYEEVATCDDDDDIDDDDNRKRHCQRDDVEKCLVSQERLHRARSEQEPCRKKKEHNVKRYSESVSKMRNVNELLRQDVKTIRMDSVELFNDLRSKTIVKDDQIFSDPDDFLWNLTTDSSSGASIKRQFVIDNGSMTNFLSSTDSSLEMIKYPAIAENDNEETPCRQELSLRRRPGSFSFAHLQMNPYFLAETKLSETTCGETIEVNLIPISMSTAIIDSRESSLFTVARSNIFRDITEVSSTLRICYDDDLENGNLITEIDEDEIDEVDGSNMRVIQAVQIIDVEDDYENDGNYQMEEKHNVSLEDITENQIQESKHQVEFQNVQTDTPNVNLINLNDKDLTKSQSNVISQQSSSYFTGNTSSSTNRLGMEAFRVSNNNAEEDSNVREIYIPVDIIEICIDSCVDLINSRERSRNTPSQLENEAPTECPPNSNDASNKSSALYFDAKTSQTSDDIHKSEAPIAKEPQRKSEGLFFDGSIRYRKPSFTRSIVQNTKKSPRTSNINSVKSKPTKVDKKLKSTVSVEPLKRRHTTNSSQLTAKSNLSIISDNSKDLATDFTKSTTRPSSCDASRERSRSYISSRRSESSSRSATVSQSDDQLKGEVPQDKSKSGTHSRHSLSSQKSFSKSCIPILKSRLDARRTEQTSRPKSPMRGPLTMTGPCRNKMDANARDAIDAAMPTEGSSPVRKTESQQLPQNGKKTRETIDEEKESNNARFKTESSKEDTNVIGENCGGFVVPREQTVIYVNLVEQHDRNVTRILDPEKFLEYAKSDSIVHNFNDSSAKLQSSMLPKIVTIVSSVSNEANAKANDDGGSSNVHISTGTLKSLWSVTIQQKEIEVTAKPSVTDTSTSISDLQQTRTETVQEHRIFGTPKELTKEEYSYLIEILTQKTNLAHLKEIQNLCNRLRLKSERSG